MRLFTAIDLPRRLSEQLNPLLPSGYDTDMRWSLPEQMHITLVFIGEVAPDQFDPLLTAIAEIEFEPFQLICSGVGHFPSGIVWLGIEANEGLQRLQQKLHHCIDQQGFHVGRRRYRPHITLGRCQSLSPELMTQLASNLAAFKAPFSVDQFVLKSSQLRPDGALHTTEAVFLAEEPSA
ncbi:RNA 2',3'-cyclic phosphodiesterase [Pontibacter sp. JAM-7]|uniref:RNA 2',3'-cyclic phosphodiesterase n=1 Tax=Pontibacter sp. JAM-7 TaxID=3366581 RepID=UPI003AF6ECAB